MNNYPVTVGARNLLKWIVFFLWASSCFAHEDVDGLDHHASEDGYLAAQVRERESQIPYQIDHLQQQLSDKLGQLSRGLLPELIKTATASNDNRAAVGEWSGITTWPFAFASAANLPDGKILAWGANTRRDFSGGNFTYASVWDPATGQFTTVNNPVHSMFCGMPVLLEDGRVFVAGGDSNSSTSVKRTSTYNYQTQTWTRIQDMNVGRWYNGIVALPSGKVFTAVGQPGSPYPELWSQNSGWSYLNGASLQSGLLKFPTVTEPINWLPHVHLAPNGQVLHSGHGPQMNYIDLEGNGSVVPVSLANSLNISNTPSVFVNEGVILQTGGAERDAYDTATRKSSLVDMNSNVPSREQLADMAYPRIFHNEVILPNGEVMVIGGNTTGQKFSDYTSQNTPEIWNPVSKTWREVAPHSVPRVYHSVALLMTDGRVWSGGGGICYCSADHQDSQVYSPPYLYNPDGSLADRPVITNAPGTVSYGQTINVTATPGLTKFTMIKMSATTHARDSDARILTVPFVNTVDGEYGLTLHTNQNVMTPGYWMLFALNQQGVPSVAKVIKVSTSNVPRLTVPDDQNAIIGDTVSLNILASDPNNDSLVFDAVGLPLGLTINGNTGVISGVPKAFGSSRVVITVSDGSSTVSGNFVWTVVRSQTPAVASTLFGNTNFGTPFADIAAPDDILTSVNMYISTTFNGIQGVLNTGNLPVHGTTSGTLNTITWPSDEYLVRIYGLVRTYGAYFSQISFVTNTGRVYGPFGKAQDWNSVAFDYTVPQDHEIIGFTGTSATYINSIGVMHRLRQIRNQPPVVVIVSNQVNTVGDSVELSLSASDPEGDALIFTATGLPQGLSLNSTNGNITGSPENQGNYDVIVRVQDSKGGQTALNFTWAVNASSMIIDPITTTPQPVGTSVNLSANASGASGIQYKWSFGDNTPETAYSSSPNISHNFDEPGLYVVRLTVKSGNGATETKTFVQAIHLPHTANKPSASSNVMVSKDGSKLWVVNQDNDSVSVFEVQSNDKLAETTVDKGPRSIAEAPDGNIWVVNKYSATISVLNSADSSLIRKINLPFGSQPFGLAFTPDGSAAYVALQGSGKLLKLDPVSGAQLASINVGSDPRHLSITADGAKVLVSRFISKPVVGESTATIQTPVVGGGEVVVVNTATLSVSTINLRHSDMVDDTGKGSGIPNYLGVPAISPDGSRAWVPSKQDNVKRGTLRNGNNINFQNTVRGINSKINLITMAEEYNERMDFDNSGLAGASIYDKSGSYLFVALEATREVAIVNAYSGTELDRIAVGRAPDGLALSADGNKLFVNNFMDRTISVVDLTNVFTRGEWNPPVVFQLSAVSNEKLAANVLKGKQLFYDAKDTRLARDGYLSCAVCHNDGTQDGRVWDLTGMGEGLRNTIELRGRSGSAHGLLHWSANFDEVQDFEGQIRSLASGVGLMTDEHFAATSETLGTPKAGLSDDLDALAAYLGSLNQFDPSPFRNADGSLTADAVAGKAVFVSAGCVQCHGGDGFTDSPSGQSHDVGTIKPTSGKRLNGLLTALDTPTLRDVWKTAPYLHDGSAATLEAAISAHTSVASIVGLSSTQLSQVAGYIQQIGGTEPAPDQSAPSVTITAPTENATVSGDAVTVAADATDNEQVAGVQFKLDGANLGQQDITPPYTTTWDTTGLTNGTHTLTAVAHDNSGNSKESVTVSVTVSNAPPPDTTAPQVSLTSPVGGATVTGSTVAIAADATDNVGVVGVQFKLDGANLGAEDTVAPYSVNWDTSGATNGSHTLTAVARDTAGNTKVSAAVTVTVNNAALLPDVIVTAFSYSNGIFTSTIKNQGSAPTPAGVSIGVGYFVDGRYRTYGSIKGPLAAGATATIGTATPYIIPSGTRTILAKVDDINRFAESDESNNSLSQTIQIGGSDTTPPTVALTSPASGTTVSGNAQAVTATAADNVGVIGVQFKLDGANLGAEDTVAPYSVNWDTTGATNGSHTLTAVARDAAGNSVASAAVSVTVNNSQTTLLPDVIVTAFSYSNGVFTSTIKNQGSAPTPAGVSIGVGYFVDGHYRTYGSIKGPLAAGATATIGTATPYIIPSGTHTILAKVDDINRFAESDESNNSLSQTIQIGGSDTTPPTVALTSPASGATVSGNAQAVTATAADNVGVIGVQFKLDGANLGAEDTVAPYSVNWDTTGATNGSHTLTAVARDAAGNSIASAAVSVTVNNSQATQLPDVIVTDLTYNNGVFTSTVKNIGTAAVPNGVTVGVSYYVNGVYRTYGVHDTGLAAGASVTIGTTWSEYVIPNGTVTISAEADDNNRFDELDETNNLLSQQITVNNDSNGNLPDVVVTAFSYTNGVFNCTVKNQGTAAIPAGVTIGVSYYVNGVDYTYGTSEAGLAAGASVNIGTTGPTYVIPSGNVTISAEADDNNRFAELDETNNLVSQPLTVP